MRQELGILERAFLLVITQPIPFGEQRFYRLRFPEQPFTEFNRQGFGPPPIHSAPFDRCSIKGHPVMYTSVNPATCFQEVLFVQPDPVGMQIGYLSEWKVRAGCELKVVPFVYHDVPESSDLHGVVASMHANVSSWLREYYHESDIAGVLATLEYLSRLFNDDKYKSISSFIGHSHLYVDHANGPDAFLYPSAQADHLRANFAFHPNCLTNLELTYVWECAIKDHIPQGKSFEIKWLREFTDFERQLTVRPISVEESNALSQELLKDIMGYYDAKARR
ncbi:MAG: RES domain-containing protein [Flavobacteriales bacterium]|nr:RES domain-containing protein [Flavobacteriales bacterium]MCC6938768.1 RES domain-containing protein [Flavobacteriales bacterium]